MNFYVSHLSDGSLGGSPPMAGRLGQASVPRALIEWHRCPSWLLHRPFVSPSLRGYLRKPAPLTWLRTSQNLKIHLSAHLRKTNFVLLDKKTCFSIIFLDKCVNEQGILTFLSLAFLISKMVYCYIPKVLNKQNEAKHFWGKSGYSLNFHYAASMEIVSFKNSSLLQSYCADKVQTSVMEDLPQSNLRCYSIALHCYICFNNVPSLTFSSANNESNAGYF